MILPNNDPWPNDAWYPLQMLTSVPIVSSQAEYTELTGKPCPEFKFDKPLNYYVFPPELFKGSSRFVTLDCVNTETGEVYLQPFLKEEIAEVNIPSSGYSGAVTEMDSAKFLPIRKLQPFEKIMQNNVIGGAHQMVRNTRIIELTPTNFTEQDRQCLKEIHKWLWTKATDSNPKTISPYSSPYER